MSYDSQRACTVLFGGLHQNIRLGDTWELPSNIASTAATFGTGCGIPALDLSPIANAGPIINTTAQAAVNNVPSPFAFVALGGSRTAIGPFPLPLSLSGFGMPGCDLLQSFDASLPTAPTGPGTATFSLPIPNLPNLMGLHLYLQGWAIAPGVNPASVIVSNGIDWGVGNS